MDSNKITFALKLYYVWIKICNLWDNLKFFILFWFGIYAPEYIINLILLWKYKNTGINTISETDSFDNNEVVYKFDIQNIIYIANIKTSLGTKLNKNKTINIYTQMIWLLKVIKCDYEYVKKYMSIILKYHQNNNINENEYINISYTDKSSNIISNGNNNNYETMNYELLINLNESKYNYYVNNKLIASDLPILFNQIKFTAPDNDSTDEDDSE